MMDLEQQFQSGRPEARSVAFTDLDVAADGRGFDGYAAVYGQEADLGDFTEVIVAPAFRGAIERSGNIPMLWDHNEAMPPFATTSGGTLEVMADGRGLRVKAQIDERHLLGPTLMSMLERGDVKAMSFGFITGEGNSKVSVRGGKPHRILRGFDRLLDVSPTWNPAYEGTSAELRSLRQMASLIDVPQQFPEAEVSEPEDGADVENQGEVVPDQSEAAVPVEEQRSGADWQVQAAARKRRLQMMGLSVPE
jgi:HK97 family phage prohead protease